MLAFAMRASIYNAMPIERVKRLVEYMWEVEAKGRRVRFSRFPPKGPRW